MGEEAVSRSELEDRANRLAHHLGDLGIGGNVVVGVCLERSVDLVVALLAIFKVGAAYLPLDPAYPRARLEYMLRDSGAAALVAGRRSAEGLDAGDVPVVDLDADADVIARHPTTAPGRTAGPDDLAYVLYTSGSTGTPKGVMAEHRAVVNRLAWMQEAYPMAPGEVACARTRLSFVDSVCELFGPLTSGIPLVIVPEAEAVSPAALVGALARHGVTRLVAVPSLLRAVLGLDDRALDGLRVELWVSSGEVLSVDLADRLLRRFPRARLLNLYGSTEVAADATCFEVGRGRGAGATVPIGRPIANTRVHVLDRRRRPVPEGVPGELYVGGAGLARGYLGRPELTAERFVPDPFRPGERLYRTGDRVRALPDGDLEFLGRLDEQVKVRGFRVEPGEIEAVVRSDPGVREAAVVPWDDGTGDTRLVAYVVPEPGTEPAELRRFARDRLPEHMVPNLFVPLDELPRLPNGKLDRRALAERRATDGLPRPSYEAPRTIVEEAVAGAYGEALGVDRVSVTDDFFELGGHSLIATRVASLLGARFSIDVPLAAVFENPTVTTLAAALEDLLIAEIEGLADEEARP